MSKLFSFFSEVNTELKKVTWPTRKEVVNYLSLVIAISAIVAIFVGGVDFSLTKGMEYLLSR